MLTALEVRNYRGFRHFRLDGLRRVNLLVGENNSGKTSLLEAINILAYGTSPLSLWQIMARRNERLPYPDDGRKLTEMDVAHFFYGHMVGIGSSFRLVGETVGPWSLDAKLVESQFTSKDVYNDDASLMGLDEHLLRPPLALRLKGIHNETQSVTPLSPQGGLSLTGIRRSAEIATNAQPIPVVFVPTTGLAGPSLKHMWEQAVLAGTEEDVSDALRIIEPTLKDVWYVSGTVGFFAGLQQVTSRVPLGSLGDGMARLFALALAVRTPRGGYLLVDEIDTGLHYTALPKMWRLIIETARRLGVQVIATTHSEDCVRSLASVCESSPELADDVTLHRIEKGFPQSTAFTAEELAIGARQQMEFR